MALTRLKLFIIVSVLSIFTLFFFNTLTRGYLIDKSSDLANLSTLIELNEHLNQELLNASKKEKKSAIKKIEERIEEALRYVQHQDVLKHFQNSFEDKKKQITSYLELESQLNAQIAALQNIAQEPAYTKIVNSALLLHFLEDKKHLYAIEEKRKSLLNEPFPDKQFMATLQEYMRTLLAYQHLKKAILENKDIHFLKDAKDSLVKDSQENIDRISYLVYFMILIYIIGIATILYFLDKSKRENERLVSLQDRLQKNLRTDIRSNLPNRVQFHKDIKELKEPCLILININNLNDYNHFFGYEVSSKIMKHAIDILKSVTKNRYYKIYQFNSDILGILLNSESKYEVQNLSKRIIKMFSQKKVYFNNIYFYMSVNIGISYTKPLVEKAYVAIRYAKAHNLKSFAFYESVIEYDNYLRNNYKLTSDLKEAIENDRIILFFQPIIDLKNNSIFKYEVLARVLDKEGEVQSIYPYLKISKSAKLYHFITDIVIRKSFEYFSTNDANFSVNLSIEDFLDTKLMKKILMELRANPSLAKRATFEILENEEITNYTLLNRYISKLKSYGVKIALDDFGSSYSNIVHISQMDLDIIKIDGSLIKDIDKNESSRKIVQAVISYAQSSGIKTVAEFVHNAKIDTIVQEIGIDYGQGYFYAKPSGTL
jgi:EAL domain-containing protein (putative c-di-GMP-specific phosphodiesterase class I)/GGDEF domain-containing protein